MKSAAAALALAVAACGTAPGAAGGPVANLGSWSGDIRFTLSANALTDLVLHMPLACTGDGGCTASTTGPITGSIPAATSFDTTLSIEGHPLTLRGGFTSATAASGVALADLGPCCQAAGVWTANWDAPAVTDASGDSGSVGTWGSASTGSLSPYAPRLVDAAIAAPAGASTEQQAMAVAVEKLRAQLGLPSIAVDSHLQQAAQAHADFYVQHAQQYSAAQLSPHSEDASFGAGFTGSDPQSRVSAAGWTGGGVTEVMAFSGSTAGALQGWLDTVYHRIPLLSPTSGALGYGQAKAGSAQTEVMDVAAGGSVGPGVVVYPWPGQTGVAGSWYGNEGPQPPAPPQGFPSGPVISLTFAQPFAVTKHELRDGTGAPRDHVWLDTKNDSNLAMFSSNVVTLYANQPLGAGSYQVHVEATVAGQAETIEWTFTVGP